MTVWTPASTIVVKVLGLAWRGDELLAVEVHESSGRIKGVRPPGGTVEFGESREAAIHREFMEELGCAITLKGPWHVLENIYEHEGATGHEIVFVANIALGDPGLYEKDRIDFVEANGVHCSAVWASPSAMPAGVVLYPANLPDLIEAGTITPP